MENEPILGNQKDNPQHLDSEVIVKEPPSHLGLIIGILIVLLTVVFIGLYIWSQMIISTPELLPPTPQRPTAQENNEPESTTAEAQTEILNIFSTSDELSAIEADLESTTIDDMDADLNAIEAELNESFQ